MSDTESNGSGDYSDAWSNVGLDIEVSDIIVDARDKTEGDIVGELKFHGVHSGKLDVEVTLDNMCHKIAELTLNLAKVAEHTQNQHHDTLGDIEYHAQWITKLQKQIDWLAFDKRNHTGKKGKGKAKSKP